MPGRGTNHGSERIALTDPATGVEFTQVTNAPVHSQVIYYEVPSFTADDRSFLFLAQRHGMRGSPLDIFRVDADGMNLVQLTDESHPLNNPRLAPDKPRIAYCVRGDGLYALDIDTFAEKLIARSDEATALGEGSGVDAAVTGDGRYYAVVGRRKSDGERIIVRFRTDGSEVVTFHPGVPNCHLTANVAGTMLMYSGLWDGNPRYALVCTIDGDDLRPLAWQQHAHCTWFGRSSELQGTYLPPGHGLIRWGIDDAVPRPIAGGPYFWHSAASEDGEWIVADTNWPDEGIMLCHVASGRYAPLVKPAGTLGHGQETHPHPSFNRAGTQVIFNSNETGLAQVYVCTIPDYLREELVTGKLSHRRKFRK